MSHKGPIMNRMKENYEFRHRHYLTRRIPVIIRLDLKSASKYTAPLKDRFHEGFIEVMNLTGIKLCQEIQGAQVAFIQSDEISILLHDYKTLQSEAWFDYCQNKVESISAAIASATFSLESWRIWEPKDNWRRQDSEYGKPNSNLGDLIPTKAAYFDSRAFNLPEAEVNNAFVGRQRDAIRNSINSLGQSLYSQKQLQDKNISEVQELCFQKGYNWNDLPTYKKRGRCIIKTTYQVEDTTRTKWIVDNEIPEFTQDKNYIEKYLTVEEN